MTNIKNANCNRCGIPFHDYKDSYSYGMCKTCMNNYLRESDGPPIKSETKKSIVKISKIPTFLAIEFKSDISKVLREFDRLKRDYPCELLDDMNVGMEYLQSIKTAMDKTQL